MAEKIIKKNCDRKELVVRSKNEEVQSMFEGVRSLSEGWEGLEMLGSGVLEGDYSSKARAQMRALAEGKARIANSSYRVNQKVLFFINLLKEIESALNVSKSPISHLSIFSLCSI